MTPSRTPRARLPLLITGATLAVGSLACLGYLLWPGSTARPPAGTAPAGGPVVAASGAAKGEVEGKPRGKAEPRGREGVVRPGSTANGPGMAPGARSASPHKGPTPPAQTAANTIQGPLQWRRNGPPVWTPAPGQAGARPPQVTVLGRVASPDGTHRNVQGQSLPFLLPARSRPTPAPASTQPKAN